MTPRARLTAVCVALLAAAGALTCASALTWYTAEVSAVGRAPVPVAVRGAQVSAGLDAVALLALAGVAAAVALAGVARRLLGAGLALAGGLLGVAVAGRVAAALTGTEVAVPSAVPAGVGIPPEVTVTAAPWLAAGGVSAMIGAGLVLLVADRRLPRWGARHAAPGARHQQLDPDRAAWDALDAGRDPTEE